MAAMRVWLGAHVLVHIDEVLQPVETRVAIEIVDAACEGDHMTCCIVWIERSLPNLLLGGGPLKADDRRQIRRRRIP